MYALLEESFHVYNSIESCSDSRFCYLNKLLDFFSVSSAAEVQCRRMKFLMKKDESAGVLLL